MSKWLVINYPTSLFHKTWKLEQATHIMVFDVSVVSKFQHRVGTFLFSFAHTSATLGLELRTWNLLSEDLDAALGEV